MEKARLRITRGQHVAPEKLALARQFRKSPASDERALWDALRNEARAGLHFRRQQVIDGLIVDFYCAAVGIAIELDGPIHAAQMIEDAERDRALASRGVRTIRIASERVRLDLDAVLKEIAAASITD
jgi:very-short-patch-repair endonuclease